MSFADNFQRAFLQAKQQRLKQQQLKQREAYFKNLSDESKLRQKRAEMEITAMSEDEIARLEDASNAGSMEMQDGLGIKDQFGGAQHQLPLGLLAKNDVSVTPESPGADQGGNYFKVPDQEANVAAASDWIGSQSEGLTPTTIQMPKSKKQFDVYDPQTRKGDWFGGYEKNIHDMIIKFNEGLGKAKAKGLRTVKGPEGNEWEVIPEQLVKLRKDIEQTRKHLEARIPPPSVVAGEELSINRGTLEQTQIRDANANKNAEARNKIFESEAARAFITDQFNMEVKLATLEQNKNTPWERLNPKQQSERAALISTGLGHSLSSGVFGSAGSELMTQIGSLFGVGGVGGATGFNFSLDGISAITDLDETSFAQAFQGKPGFNDLTQGQKEFIANAQSDLRRLYRDVRGDATTLEAATLPIRELLSLRNEYAKIEDALATQAEEAKTEPVVSRGSRGLTFGEAAESLVPNEALKALRPKGLVKVRKRKRGDASGGAHRAEDTAVSTPEVPRVYTQADLDQVQRQINNTIKYYNNTLVQSPDSTPRRGRMQALLNRFIDVP